MGKKKVEQVRPAGEPTSTDSEVKKEAVTIYLPAEYAGRCNDRDCYSTRLFFPESNNAFRFEIKIPFLAIVAGEDAQELFNYSTEIILTKLAQSIGTTIDSACIKMVRESGLSPEEMRDTTEGKKLHLQVQEYADSWRYAERKGSKTVKLTVMLDQLVSRGTISREIADTIETVDQLMLKVSELIAGV
jgi:hypothetical protein